MRLGGFFRPETIAELAVVGDDLDRHGLSAVVAPRRIAAMGDDEAVEFGEVARTLGVVVGESIPNLNLMVRDEAARSQRIEALRAILRKSDLMECHGSVILVGSVAPADHIAATTRTCSPTRAAASSGTSCSACSTSSTCTTRSS
jgi:sugar phosphate isomerase/epimerase